MKDLKSKSTNNLKAVRTINILNGLFGLRDCIWDKSYKGASELGFWMNGSFNLHKIVEYPSTIDKLIHVGEDRVLTSLNQYILSTFEKKQRMYCLQPPNLEITQNQNET